MSVRPYLFASLLLACGAIAHAETTQTFKCRDGAGRTVYSNESCEKQGLKAIGPVKDRVMVVPAVSAPDPAASKKAAAAKDNNGKKANQSDEFRKPGPAAETAIRPLLEKLAK